MTRCLTDSIYDTVDERVRAEGRDWPARAHTMIGFKRLANIRTCVEAVLDDGVPGDLIETGVWRGGAAIFMRAILKARAVTNRVVWVADSFSGLPPPDTARYPQDEGITLHQSPQLAVPLERVHLSLTISPAIPPAATIARRAESLSQRGPMVERAAFPKFDSSPPSTSEPPPRHANAMNAFLTGPPLSPPFATAQRGPLPI